MATTQTIHGYASAATIDPVADYLLIDPASSGNYNKINRNVLLGITAPPLGTTSTQNVSSKTLDNTNTLTLKDSFLTLQNSSDVTKQANFSLASITTGTTRTYTLPNASVTLASLSGVETLTNKTITGATITGGSIDNTTITVDSISGHTVGTIVTVGGVQMNNGIVATAGSVNTNSIAAGAVVPNSLVASSGSGWSWQSWTPTLTNLTIGNGSMSAKYAQTGKTITFRIIVTTGTTTSVGTSPRFTLPVAANADYGTTGLQFYIGNTYLNGNTANWVGLTTIDATTGVNACRMLLSNVAGTYPTAVVDVTASVPDTWPSGSHFILCGTYEAA